MGNLSARRLGSQGLVVSELGLGCVGMSMLYGPPELDESRAAIERALERGCTFFDTSDAYGLGHNESFLGEVLAGLGARGREAVLATKFGIVPSGGALGYRVNGRPEHAVESCDASLARLRRDVIDLYYLHRMDPDTPIEETVGALSRLVEAGKLRFIGLCECAAETLRRAQAVHPISAVQTEYNLFSRDVEAELLPTCRELGVGLVPYSPLGRGLLTGRVTDTESLTRHDYRRTNPRFAGGNLERNLEIVRDLEMVARELDCTVGQLALAWLLAEGPDIVPIPGTKRRKWLDENIGAAEVATRMTLSQREALREIAREERVAGLRYDEDELARLGL